LTESSRGLRMKDLIAPLASSIQERSSFLPLISTSRMVVFWSSRSTASLTRTIAARLCSPTRIVSPLQSGSTDLAARQVCCSSLRTWTLPSMEAKRPAGSLQAFSARAGVWNGTRMTRSNAAFLPDDNLSTLFPHSLGRAISESRLRHRCFSDPSYSVKLATPEPSMYREQ
jgi:hypothetical protein